MFDASDQAIGLRLDELDGLDTVSAFSHCFYVLIAQLVSVVAAKDAVRVALAGLLDVELRYQGELKQLSERQQVSLADLQAASQRHRLGLESVLKFASRLQCETVIPDAARGLVLAACHYDLRQTAEVVRVLEYVLQLGIEQPLVQFALGYNRYLLALEKCPATPHFSGTRPTLAPVDFQLRCLQAMSALEDGLRGDELDGQLYWWIGVISEAAGLTEAAQDAYDKSAAALEAAGERAEGGPARLETWEMSNAAITDDEVWMAGEMLKGRFDPSELLGNEPEERS